MLEKLLHLADVVSYADFAPTDSQVEVGTKLTRDIAHDRERLDGVLSRTLTSFNAMLRERSLGAIDAPKEELRRRMLYVSPLRGRCCGRV